MPKPKFAVGDIVDWDAQYIHDTDSCKEYLKMTGPFVVIRSGITCDPDAPCVSLRRHQDEFEPTHTGTGVNGEAAPFGGNNWDQQFFKLNDFLTAVHQRRKHGV